MLCFPAGSCVCEQGWATTGVGAACATPTTDLQSSPSPTGGWRRFFAVPQGLACAIALPCLMDTHWSLVLRRAPESCSPTLKYPPNIIINSLCHRNRMAASLISSPAEANGAGLFFDGATPTVAGWVILTSAAVVAAALAAWAAFWWRGHVACCCIPRRRLHVREMVPYGLSICASPLAGPLLTAFTADGARSSGRRTHLGLCQSLPQDRRGARGRLADVPSGILSVMGEAVAHVRP